MIGPTDIFPPSPATQRNIIHKKKSCEYYVSCRTLLHIIHVYVWGSNFRLIVYFYICAKQGPQPCTWMMWNSITWCFSDRASWIDNTLITNLMHWLLFIHKILFSSTCFEPQVLIFRRIQLYTCSIWYCHSLREFVVACRYTAWVRTDCRGKVVGIQ